MTEEQLPFARLLRADEGPCVEMAAAVAPRRHAYRLEPELDERELQKVEHRYLRCGHVRRRFDLDELLEQIDHGLRFAIQVFADCGGRLHGASV